MQINEHGDIMVIRQKPVIVWLVGVFFVVVGSLFLYGSFGGYSNINEMTPTEKILHMLFGSAAIFAGICTIYTAPSVILTIDRSRRMLSFKRRNIFKPKASEYSFDDVSGFTVTEDRDSEGDPIWNLTLNLTHGDEINISSFGSPDEQFKRDFAFRANGFMYKHLPSVTDTAADELETAANPERLS